MSEICYNHDSLVGDIKANVHEDDFVQCLDELHAWMEKWKINRVEIGWLKFNNMGEPSIRISMQ